VDHSAHRHLMQCDECTKPAVWVRRTLFAGNHYLCTTPAQREEDVGQDDPSYYFWEVLTATQDDDG
jgi:hypothetical protein